MTTSLPLHPASPAMARRFVTEAATKVASGLGGNGALDDIALITSEVVTNALVHARSPVELTVQSLPDGIRIEVIDADPRPPVMRPAGASDVGGRGMHIVATVARTWGVTPLSADAGKSVWFEFGPRPSG
ncbi:MAG: ATP-binding protein [Acidimicrobiia bacterium]